jgi:hypothetical protein
MQRILPTAKLLKLNGFKEIKKEKETKINEKSYR